MNPNAIIIGSQKEAHLLGTLIYATYFSCMEFNGDLVNLYHTDPPLFRLNGDGPIKFLAHHLAFLPPEEEASTNNCTNSTISV